MSGGPIFYENEGEFIVVGIHHGIKGKKKTACLVTDKRSKRFAGIVRRQYSYDLISSKKGNQVWSGISCAAHKKLTEWIKNLQ